MEITAEQYNIHLEKRRSKGIIWQKLNGHIKTKCKQGKTEEKKRRTDKKTRKEKKREKELCSGNGNNNDDDHNNVH